MSTELTQEASDEETREHIAKVQDAMGDVSNALFVRAINHDASKLAMPESGAYRALRGEMAGVTYGTPEYNDIRAKYDWIVQQHVSVNDHHVQYHMNGIAGMSLLSLMEMLSDWRGSAGGKPIKLTLNVAEYNIPPVLASILSKTLVELGWEFE